jgi:alkylation response protein AidB-like acyl-CoA dehydrogenase
MDFSLSEDQKMFKRSVRDFLEKECPRTLVREIENNKQDYLPEMYKKMAGLGWLGIMIPEKYGGMGGSWVDLAIFCEEAGRAMLPSPHWATVCLGAQVLITFGTEAQKCDILPRIANGEAILALALAEPELGSNLSLLTTTAIPDKDDYVINGTKLPVSSAHLANWIITVTKTDDGVTLFLVDGKSRGLTCTPMDTLSGERLNEVVFDNVRVPKNNMLGELNRGVTICEVMDNANIMSCASMLGNAEMAMELALDFSKQRQAFGRPIGAFQALQHRMADMLLALESLRWLIYSTTWMMSEGLPCSRERAMTQLRAGELCSWVTAAAIHIFGAVGIMLDSDMPFFYRRAKAAQLSLGYAESFKESIAKGLGL